MADLREFARLGAQHRVQELRAEINRILSLFPDLRNASTLGQPRRAIPLTTSRRKGGISPEGRRRIAEAQRKRWAAKRDAKQASDVVAGVAQQLEPRTKGAPRQRSAAARKRMSRAQKKRWAKARKGR